MRKFLLLAGIFTVLACNTAKAEYYYKDDGVYYREEPRYTRSVEYASDREYQKPQPRYERVRRSEVREVREPQYHKKEYVQYEEPNKIRPYIGIDVATSKMEFAEDEYGYSYEDAVEDSYNSISFVVGARINKNFGVEAFYQQSGDENKNFVSAYGGYAEDYEITTNFTAMGIDFQGYAPVNHDFELLASLGLGLYGAEIEERYNLNGYREEDKEDISTLGIRVGIGAQYNLTNNLAIRGMARYVKMNDDEYVKSLTELSLGLRYMF